MAAPDDQEPSFPAAVYQKVKAWVAEQEAFEKENKTSAPLTDVQRAFLDSFCSPPQLLDTEKDYVSVLNQYRQLIPTGNKITFVDSIHPVKNAKGAPQWTCTVELSETRRHEPTIESFPAAGRCPPFTKKKDAKQYAAKCALDWLDKKSLLPSHLGRMAFHQSYAPTAGPLSVLQNQSQQAKRRSEVTNGVLSPPPPKRKATGTNCAVGDDDAANLTATDRVKNLCPKLGLKAPIARVTLTDPNVADVFDGYPDFGDDEVSFPEDLGRVTGVTGEANAKQAVSEKVLVYLLDLHQKRAAELQLLTESSGL